MRVFVAIDLTPPAREAVTAVTADLKRHEVFHSVSMKWVARDNLHVTLRFLGEVDVSDLAGVTEALQRDFRQCAFHMTLEHVGLFPPQGAPRVVWFGAGRGATALRALHDEVERRLDDCGFPCEGRAFSAHVTVGRVRRARRADGDRLRAVLAGAAVAVPSWRVDQVVLYESRLSRHGSSYHAVSRTSLRPE